MTDIVFIDHYDSFSLNLVDWLSATSTDLSIQFFHFDDKKLSSVLEGRPKSFVFSPGPKSPSQVAASRDLMRQLIGRVPVLGVCLGHQILGEILGYKLIRSQKLVHGALDRVRRKSDSLILAGMPAEFSAARYNSLALQSQSAGHESQIKARSDHGEIMAIEYRPAGGWPAFGLQFHPESFLMKNASGPILQAWLTWVRKFAEAAELTSWKPSPQLPRVFARLD